MAQENGRIPEVAQGRIERLPSFPSRYVAPRNVDVWLPPGYDGKSRCPVIYMQDGQMLFDPRMTWNQRSWGMAETVAHLVRDKRMPATIVVGVWSNGPQRFSEYFPEKALGLLAAPVRTRFVEAMLKGPPQGDNYLRFIVHELKPEIDRRYATRPERAHTAIMGSSMGALISMYAFCEYPEIFGAAGCLSTHWTGFFERNAAVPLALFGYLQGHIPNPKGRRIYFDHGTETLDALYAEPQASADLLFKEKGYADPNYLSRVFPGSAHAEDDWAQRVSIPLIFLSGP
jgi:enterochelin esterase-like enzyme